MEFKLKQYHGTRTFIEYSDDKNNLFFTNAEYFIFDVTSSTFQEIMEHIGGFTANMTTRYIKKNNLNAKYIMLCCIPQENACYLFKFVYLDEDYNILSEMADDNYFDYQYFKEKFNDCIVKVGLVYELEEIPNLKDLTKEFCESHDVSFGFSVDGEPVQFKDVLYSSNMEIFKEDIKENLKALDAKEIRFTFVLNHLGFIMMEGTIFTSDGTVLLDYQVESGIKDKAEYIKMEQKEDSEFSEAYVCDKPCMVRFSLEDAKKMANKLKLYRRKCLK